MNGSVSMNGSTLLSGSLNVNTEGGIIESKSVYITENGDRTITAPAGIDGYSPIMIHTNVPQQAEPVLDDITITENGTYTPPSGTDGYNDITVNVPSSDPVLDDITITENGNYTPPTGTDGYNDITVNVPQVQPVLDTLIVSQNGQYTPPSGVAGYNLVDVNVFPVVNSLTVNSNGTYTPPTGVDGYNSVIVNVPGFSVNQIAASLELTNEVNVNYNTANQLQSGHDYLIIANTDLGVRSAIFTYNGATNVVDLLDLGGRFTINMSQSSCYWDWNSGGASWCSINVFELISPLLPTHS